MKVLVIGGGGREHALVWKISKSPKVSKIFCAPGNAGISRIAECVSIRADDVQGLLSFVKHNKIDVTVVGPEAPLVLGISDAFRSEGLKIFGPSKAASKLEGSKAFSKNIMLKYNIPTAEAGVFTDYDNAIEYIRKKGTPIVIKADGLAAGKGVIVATNEKEATDAVKAMMIDMVYGDAGKMIIIEECLTGEEASFLVFTDGRDIIPMPLSKDHKRVFDDDKGPNTGGMGAYSPVPGISDEMYLRIMDDIIVPVIEGLEREGYTYEGVLYTGLMITRDGPRVLEFNCRFGDPEAQPIIMRLSSDIMEIIEGVVGRRLGMVNVKWSDSASVCVVMASGGYPDKYRNGKIISGLNDVAGMEDVMVFHAGSANNNENIVTAGGRVLGVTTLGEDIGKAKEKAYEAVSKIYFDGMHYRKDIGRV
ncbi:MAG TPA: phosphoribosylamine--glycine ligase [Nitrospiraceae bacterium]|nr:phosphoribosylamine--glycine ligase [Nitrospiraceae bacterium]